jgi:hypothetical protein
MEVIFLNFEDCDFLLYQFANCSKMRFEQSNLSFLGVAVFAADEFFKHKNNGV